MLMRRATRNLGWKAAAVALAVGLVGGWVANSGPASASLPADKPFAAASKLVRFSPGTRVPLLSATVRNSKPTDIVLAVTMECSILTDNVILGSDTPGAQESAATEGTVRAWLEIDGQVVPIISQSSPPQSPPPPGDDTDKVTFCNRVFNRTVADRESPPNGIDYSRDYIETKTATAFNWVRLNVGSGVHTVALYGDLSHFATTGSTASAYVGNRSMIGLPGKFANDATVSETATG
ncbi:MAG: hypothetical protein ABR520_09555 [Mycobacteriales bacterium]|nr:hypothetical protein [Frankia sp.]